MQYRSVTSDSEGPLVSFHLVRFRPSARLADLRLLLHDPRVVRETVPGCRGMASAVCGGLQHGFNGISFTKREVIAFWDSDEAYAAFLNSGVFARWQSCGTTYSVLMRPEMARGPWLDGHQLDEVAAIGRVDGPVAVISYVRIPVRHMFRWYTQFLPKVGGQMASAEGLVAGTGGADLTARKTFTMTFWTESKAMLKAAYSREGAHGGAASWGKPRLPTASFARLRVLSHTGSWDGVDPLAL